MSICLHIKVNHRGIRKERLIKFVIKSMIPTGSHNCQTARYFMSWLTLTYSMRNITYMTFAIVLLSKKRYAYNTTKR